jgi:UDP-N-acetylglucosamine acyltransferase
LGTVLPKKRVRAPRKQRLPTVLSHAEVIGESAYVGALSGVENDIIPFGMALGNRARLKGLNIVGLKRRGIEKSRIHELRAAYRGLFAEAGTLRARLDDVLAAHGHEPLVRTVIDFIQAGGERAICVPQYDGIRLGLQRDDGTTE